MPYAQNHSGEKDRRWRRVRQFMSDKGFDCLVVAGSLPLMGEPLDRYLSTWVPGAVFIFPLKGEPTLLAQMGPQVLSLSPDTPQEEFPWIKDIRAGARGSMIAAVLEEKGLWPLGKS